MKKWIVLLLLLITSHLHAESLFLYPLGDSITKGGGSTDSWGYRKDLQINLADTYDFVGSITDPNSDPTYDVDHGGVNGERTDQIETRLNSNLSTYMSGVDGSNSCVLIHAGTNDCYQNYGTATSQVANVEDMIDIIHAYNSDIKVFVAKIIPNTDSAVNTRIIAFNSALATMVDGYSKSNLQIVDMYSVFTANGNWATEWMDDATHPNDTGYDQLAEAWANAIDGESVMRAAGRLSRGGRSGGQ